MSFNEEEDVQQEMQPQEENNEGLSFFSSISSFWTLQ